MSSELGPSAQSSPSPTARNSIHSQTYNREKQAQDIEAQVEETVTPSTTSTRAENEEDQVHNVSESNEKNDDRYVVKWDGEDDPDSPLNTPMWRKWAMTAVLAISCMCVTCCSSIAASTYGGMELEFSVSREVCILSVSLFVGGMGVGPLFLGPCSEFVGRSKVMHASFIIFFLFNLPVAFANNIAVLMIFRFFSGFFGSAFLSVSGGCISDVFPNAKVGTPMLVFSASPFLGPVLGPLLGGFINFNTYWRWSYYVILIWAFLVSVLNVTLVPETYAPELLRRKAIKKRKETGDDRYKSPAELKDKSFRQALQNSLKTPFVLLTTQYMVLFLDLWSAIILGILYLFFGGLPWVFEHQFGFNLWQTGLSFCGILVGELIAVATQPYFNKKYAQEAKQFKDGKAPPESRLRAGKYGAILCPVGLYLFALTSFSNVPWIIPILTTIFFGWGMVYAYTSTFTYLVDAYRPVSASALASNSFLRSSFAASFPLFGNQLYDRMGAIGGTLFLAGLMTLCAPLPFIFAKIGGRVREKSKFAAS